MVNENAIKYNLKMKKYRSKNIQNLAKTLRKNQTDTERFLWFNLRQYFPNIHFRRQHQIGNYIVDFVSVKNKLIIECDGGGHTKEKDKNRDNFLTSKGFKVLRFWNNEIYNNLEAVLSVIYNSLPHP